MRNFISPLAYVEPGATLGKDNHIGPFVSIYANVVLGSNNVIEGHASIGSPAEKTGFLHNYPEHKTMIGNDNVIREFVTINAGSRRSTVMGNHCLMLRGSHLSHDSILEDCVNISCNVMIGGESHVMAMANLGLSSVIHQFSVVGSYSMIGMGTICTKKLELTPGGIFVGNPGKYLKQNTVGLQRNNVSNELLELEIDRWKLLRQSNN